MHIHGVISPVTGMKRSPCTTLSKMASIVCCEMLQADARSAILHRSSKAELPPHCPAGEPLFVAVSELYNAKAACPEIFQIDACSYLQAVRHRSGQGIHFRTHDAACASMRSRSPACGHSEGAEASYSHGPPRSVGGMQRRGGVTLQRPCACALHDAAWCLHVLREPAAAAQPVSRRGAPLNSSKI